MTNCYKNIKNKGRTALRAILSLLMYERPENNPAAYGQLLILAQRRRRLLLREKTLVDEELRYLDGVGSGTLAEVVGYAP